jgi:hypothetical protein
MAERDDPDDALLAAYIDGVSELTPDERKRVEQQLGALDVDGTRQMIDQLRALPPEGTEPDWRAMERRIANAVDEVRTPWWRRWFVPVGALVMTAAALLLWIHHRPEVAPAPVAVVTPPAVPVKIDAAVPVPAAQPTELWLDGQLVDVTDADPDALFEDGDASETLTADDDGLLPTLRWVDDLDDRAIERAEHLLEKKKS